jgi:hypothetical protein
MLPMRFKRFNHAAAATLSSIWRLCMIHHSSPSIVERSERQLRTAFSTDAICVRHTPAAIFPPRNRVCWCLQNASKFTLRVFFFSTVPPQHLSRYSDGLAVLCNTPSRPAQALTLPHIQWVPAAISVRIKRPGR